MRNSSKDLSVFDFNSDVPNAEGEKLSKYKFLEAFASGSYPLKHPDLSNLPHIDLHEVDSPEQSSPDRNLAAIEGKSELYDVKACSRSYHTHDKICNNDFRPQSLVEGFVMETSTILATSAYDDEDSEMLSSGTPANLMSDEDESCTSASEASTSGDFPETDGLPECPALELCHSACEKMDDDQNTVVVCPDYINYRDTLFLESELTFCSDCVKIECSDASRTGEKLIVECGIADVIWISCQWSRSVGALLFKLWIKTNAGHDVEKYIASIADVFWLDKEKKIKSLSERYKDIWNALPDSNYALEDDMLKTHISFSKRYFSEVMEPFEDVIYPKGDPDAVSISKRDIELLEPDTFINDTIIDFYIKYLQNKVQPNEKRRFHFFNSFFFRKLADLDKDPGSISQGRAAFQRVRKWTRKLNIFEKDYIFIPVNFNLHWSLLVICHPGEISTFVDDDIKSSPKVPCILHMDSIKGSHNGLKDLIQSYLLEEWRGRHPELPDEITRRFSNIRFVPLELPQQENSSDCGLFLLHYVELFLMEAPVSFNLTRITTLSNFLTADWFPPAEASFKRFHIRGLLYELLRDSSQNPIFGCSDEDFPCSGDDANEAVEFLSAEGSPTKIVNGSTSSPLRVIQDDNFEQTPALESLPTACLMEKLEDAKADTTEHLAADENQDSSDHLVSAINDQDMCQSPVGSPTSQIYLTSCCMDDKASCELPSNYGQTKEAVIDTLSTTSNTVSNEITETQKLTFVVDDCTFVPDSSNSSDENLIEFTTILQEMDDSKMEIERQDDPPGICVAVDDRCDNDEKHLEFLVNDNKERHEDDCEITDTLETDHCKACHSLENNQTVGASFKVEDNSCMDESFGGDKGTSPPVEGSEVSNLHENNDAKETAKRLANALKEELHPHELEMPEVISLDDDVVHTKRSQISESVQQVSKRRKIVGQVIRRRVTRSCSKECTS